MPENHKPLKVLICSRNKVFFNGEAFSVSSKNEKGAFDILPQHAQFVTLLLGDVILDKGLPTETAFKIDRGVLNILGSKVDVYIGV